MRHTAGMALTRQIRRHGGSLSLVIPRDVAEAMSLEDGAEVTLTLVGDRLVLSCNGAVNELRAAVEAALQREPVHAQSSR